MNKLKANYSGLNTKRPMPEAAARAGTGLSPNLTRHSERLVPLQPASPGSHTTLYIGFIIMVGLGPALLWYPKFQAWHYVYYVGQL